MAVGVIWRKRLSAFGAIALGVTVFLGLYLLDALALVRFGSHPVEHPGVDLGAEMRRIASGNEESLMLMLFNVAAFVPFGFFLAEFLASIKRFSTGRWIGFVALAGLGLSLCIECIQLVLRVGIFEVTDLVLNTLGAFVGGSLTLLGKRFLRFARNDK